MTIETIKVAAGDICDYSDDGGQKGVLIVKIVAVIVYSTCM